MIHLNTTVPIKCPTILSEIYKCNGSSTDINANNTDFCSNFYIGSSTYHVSSICSDSFSGYRFVITLVLILRTDCFDSFTLLLLK